MTGLYDNYHRLLAALLCVILVAMPATTGGAAADRWGGQREFDPAAVDDFVAARLATVNVPGVAIAITRGTEVIHLRGYGRDAHGAPITADTPFRVASVSKSFTALAVMQLVDAGKVTLDEPVRTYLPGFATADPRAARITVRQLLDQTSGMADRGFPEVSLPQPATLGGAVERLRSARLVAEPGSQWNYHNPNYQVAARLVEVVGGEPFAAYLRRHVLGPLGMDRSTTTDTDTEGVPGLAEGHSFAYGRPIPLVGPGYFVNGSGGVVSTAADMARWLAMQNNGGVAANGARIVSAASIAAMHTASEPGGYALGWGTDGPRERPTRIEHGGCCFAWAAHQVLVPATGLGVAILLNSASPLGLDEMTIVEGVIALAQGQDPEVRVASATVDLTLGAFTLAALALGALGVRRAGRWSTRRRGAPAWRIALRLIPHLIPVGLGLAFPTLAGFLFAGRDVTWRSAVFSWPALVVFLAAVALAGGGTVAARVVCLLRQRRRRPEGSTPDGPGQGAVGALGPG